MKLSDLGGYTVTQPVKASSADNNNPLNVKMGLATAHNVTSGDAVVSNAATDGGNFLKFKDPQTGKKAAQDLLFNSDTYKSMTVNDAMKKWSGGGYDGSIQPELADKKISDLSPLEQQTLIATMAGRENASNKPATLGSLKGGYKVVQPTPPTSTENTQTPKKTLAGKIIGDVKNVGIGFAKRAESSVQGLTDIVTAPIVATEKGAVGLVSKKIAEEAFPTEKRAGDLVPDKDLQEKGTAQKVGGITEQVAELLATPEASIDKLGMSGLTDLAQKGLISQDTLNIISDAVKSKFGKIALNRLSDAAIGATQQVVQNAETKQKLGKDVGTAAAVTGALGGIVRGVSEKALGALGVKSAETIAKEAEQKSKDALEVVSPKLTASEKEEAVASGRGKKTGLLGNIKIEADKKTKEAANAVEGIVKKGKPMVENINAVRSAISDEATSLKAKIASVDHPYTFKELNSKLASLDKPISIKSDSTLSKQFDLARDAFMKIAKEKGGTVSSLLDARKSFDDLVQKEFPNLYDRENAPMRNAITSMRSAVNDFISDNLPKGSGYQDSLDKQSAMYNAIDNMATKGKEEIGTNRISRLAKRNPKITTALKMGGTALIGGEVLKKTGLLP